MSTRARTAARSASDPPNRRSSVRTLITRAPPSAYATASSAGSGIVASSPFDGLRRLTSAMTPIPGARSADITSRGGGAAADRRLISAKSTWASRAARSARTPSTMESRTLLPFWFIPVVPLPTRPCLHSVGSDVPGHARQGRRARRRRSGRDGRGPGRRSGHGRRRAPPRRPGPDRRSRRGSAGRAAYRAPKRGRRRSAGISPSPAASSSTAPSAAGSGPGCERGRPGDRGAARGSARQGGEVRGGGRGQEEPDDGDADVRARGRDDDAQQPARRPGQRDGRGDGGEGEQRDAGQPGHEVGARRRDGAGRARPRPRSP